AVVVTALAGMYAGGVYGSSGHRHAPSATASPVLGLNKAGPLINGAASPSGGVPNGVIRVAPPPGQPGVTMYAWSVTYKVLRDPADLKPHMSKEQIAKLPTRTETDLCMS